MKDIKGYEGRYAVTEDGKVWSYKSQKFLAPRTNKNGYNKVALCKNCEVKDFYIHRLVAEAYIPNPNNHPIIDHIDGNRKNNNISNLHWVTQKENINNPICKEKQCKKVYCEELNKIFPSLTQAAKEVGISTPALCMHLKGKTEAAGGYHWRYAE